MSHEILPFVSVCTPTFNRRPFIAALVKCFLAQDYPQNRMELLVIDDGSDPIGDLLPALENVHYYYLPQKICLGAKRNMLHEKAKGDIIVYMDDDDYYPVTRVSHAVQMLQAHPDVLCAGSSIMHIYFKHLKQLFQFGPYGANHATAATMAFWRKLVLAPYNCAYEPLTAIAEEKAFLKNYTVPLVQLDPLKTLLVFSHEQNTFDKRRLLENMNPAYVRSSALTVQDFISDKPTLNFYLYEITNALATYAPGLPAMKPDVLQQMAELERTRQEAALLVTISINGAPPKQMSLKQIMQLLEDQQAELARLKQLIKGQEEEINILSKLAGTI